MSETPHIPVMLNEVLAALGPQDGEVYVDGTFGAGGYSAAFLEKADCTVIAIDRDQSAIESAATLKEKYGARLVLIRGCFGDALSLVRAAGYEFVNGFVLDVGVSSMQLDQPGRGFSFRHDAPLDMRMDQTGDSQTAADVVNTLPEKELADIIYQYGEERYSRRIAKRVVERRAEMAIETTGQLADLVREAVPHSPKDKIDPATRTFQALRIYVNDELGEIERGLRAAEHLLVPQGRLVVVSFHSLEDTRVKKFMRDRAGQAAHGSRYLPAAAESSAPSFTLPSKKAVFPTKEESASNPRARSARLRWGVRTNSPSMQEPLSFPQATGGYG